MSDSPVRKSSREKKPRQSVDAKTGSPVRPKTNEERRRIENDEASEFHRVNWPEKVNDSLESLMTYPIPPPTRFTLACTVGGQCTSRALFSAPRPARPGVVQSCGVNVSSDVVGDGQILATIKRKLALSAVDIPDVGPNRISEYLFVLLLLGVMSLYLFL